MASVTAPMGGTRSIPAPSLRISDYLRWSLDHKIIGVQYMISSLFFFVIGGALAMMIRLELLTPGLDVMTSGTQYNSVMTMHGSIMIFLWIIPMMAGFGNYLVPLMLGAKDMAFPWLNAFAFWLIPPAGVLMLASWLIGAPEAGWTSYPPLSTLFSPDGQTLWAMSLHLLGISSILGAINFVVTIRNMRPEGMGYWQMPLFVWAVLATAIIQVLATPFLTGGLTLLILDRVAGTSFFDPANGGDVLLWQNVFLVLQPPGGLYHDFARLWHGIRSVVGACSQTRVRLPGDCAFQHGDCHRWLYGVGTSHVHQPATGTAHSLHDYVDDYRRAYGY